MVSFFLFKNPYYILQLFPHAKSSWIKRDYPSAPQIHLWTSSSRPTTLPNCNLLPPPPSHCPINCQEGCQKGLQRKWTLNRKASKNWWLSSSTPQTQHTTRLSTITPEHHCQCQPLSTLTRASHHCSKGPEDWPGCVSSHSSQEAVSQCSSHSEKEGMGQGSFADDKGGLDANHLDRWELSRGWEAVKGVWLMGIFTPSHFCL